MTTKRKSCAALGASRYATGLRHIIEGLLLINHEDLSSHPYNRRTRSLYSSITLTHRRNMGQLGIGAMLHYLSGGSEHSSEEYKGKIISSISIEDNSLYILFESGERIRVFDDGQSCCEVRYMKCDDDPQYLVGKTLIHIACKDAPNEPDEYGEHEVCFLEIMTNDGFITIANHNEHNGYYGGFALSIQEVK